MIARIRPLHELLHFNCLVNFPGDLGVIERRDAELLVFADPVFQRKGLGRIFCRQSWLIGIAILYCHSDVGKGEIRVKLHRAFVKRNRLQVLAADRLLVTQGVGFKCLQR